MVMKANCINKAPKEDERPRPIHCGFDERGIAIWKFPKEKKVTKIKLEEVFKEEKKVEPVVKKVVKKKKAKKK